MKNNYMILAFMLIFALGGCQSNKTKTTDTPEKADTTPQKPSILTPEEQKEGWIVLFDGSNFDNFRGYNEVEMFDNWTIEADGSMKFTPDSEGHKNIITKDNYKNFVLSLDWKISEGGNSGIFWGVLESLEYPEPYETGPEIQVLDNERHPDANVGGKTHQAGALYDMVEPSADVANPAGEWNNIVLTIDHVNNIGQVEMNGTKIVEFPVEGEKWDEMVANSKFKDWKGFGKYPNGHIGLQDHGDEVWFKNIKIKVLDQQL